ncbi:NiFe hydrogenase [Shewanella sp. SNU WT4]|uniref:Kae1-like domain-containing protein n=1 Tax=Shewanella sp. SNU WT4 TaxID=2590015 RepID=UPI0011263222|nr:NiFe hydrogenase [Shewanella sp. SNU WT4]QDF66977.1 NiFe hydrogenase [Shewanella sp. SNU WT4]
MKTVRFELTCSRPVPFYALMANHYLAKGQLDISIAATGNVYQLEACGHQADIEQLADDIAGDFLMSAWLTATKITVIDKGCGQKQALAISGYTPDYCRHCHSAFGDNQAAEFGNIHLACPVCRGEQAWQQSQLNSSVVKDLCRTLLSGDSIRLSDGSQLSLNAMAKDTDAPSILVCNPNTTHQFFSLTAHQVLALSALEKPLIQARAIDNSRLPLPAYALGFGYDRETIIISEALRQLGVDFVYLYAAAPRLALTWIDGAWCEISANSPCQFESAPMPRHDATWAQGIGSHWHKQVISCKPCASNSVKDALQVTSPQSLAQAALLGVKLEHGLRPNHHTLGLYFSSRSNGQMVYTDKDANIQPFLALPSLPSRGDELLAELKQGQHASLLAKFEQHFPQTLIRLARYQLAQADSLSALMAMSAILLDLDDKLSPYITANLSHGDIATLSAALQACAESHPSNNSPRIDFPLVTTEQGLSINWGKTLASVMAFRLADPDSIAQIAYGFHDSLADYLANWVEHLDQKWGVDAVALSGDEMANNLLCQRLALRIGKNYPLLVNRRLAISGANVAAGALYLKQRRR